MLPIEKEAEGLIERIFDVLWHNAALTDDIDENLMKKYLMENIIIQIELLRKDYKYIGPNK